MLSPGLLLAIAQPLRSCETALKPAIGPRGPLAQVVRPHRRHQNKPAEPIVRHAGRRDKLVSRAGLAASYIAFTVAARVVA